MNTENDVVLHDAVLLLPQDKLIGKMAQDLYLGNGKPALTVRMALQEENMQQVQTDIGDIKKNQKDQNKLLITTLLSSIGGLIMIGLEIYLHSGK